MTDFHIEMTAPNRATAGLELRGLYARQLLLPDQGDVTTFLADILARQVDMIAALVDDHQRAVFDLRYAVQKRRSSLPGRLHVGLLWAVHGVSGADARQRCRSIAAHVRAVVQAYCPEYWFAPLESAEAFAVFRPKPVHVAELGRRAERLPLASPLPPAGRRTVGFVPDCAPADSDHHGAPQSAYLVHALSPTVDTFARFARALVRQEAPTALSVRLEASTLTGEERTAFLGLLQTLENARTASLSGEGVTPSTAPALLDRVRAIGSALEAQLARLQHRAYVVRVQLGSEMAIPESLLHTLAGTATRPAGAVPGRNNLMLLEHRTTPQLLGGVSWRRCGGESDATTQQAFEGIHCDGAADPRAPEGLGRWRYLMGAEEAVAFFRFPLPENDRYPGLDIVESRMRVASDDVPIAGLRLGTSRSLTDARPAGINQDDRRRHLYAVGQTGTGKTTFFESLILQDMRAGRGVCVIDPHGDLVEGLLGKVPESRIDDVIYFDPADVAQPLGLNLLEWDSPEERHFLIEELVSILLQLAENPEYIGPMFLHYARNFARLVMANPKDPGTLVDLVRLYVDNETRTRWLPHLDDPMVKLFWEREWETTTSFHKSEMMTYFLSKFSPLISSPLMRNIVGQTSCAIPFDSVMNDGKILLVNLAKGRLGEQAARVLGMVIVARLASTAMKRVEIPEPARRDFYLYVDEFQNLATAGFGALLAEARKFRLSLQLTNQFVSQLSDASWARHLGGAVEKSLLGNVGTIVAFRSGPDDAKLLDAVFSPDLSPRDLINLPNFRACVSTLVNGVKARPFTVDTHKDQHPYVPARAGRVRARSRQRYGRDRAIVEAEIEASMKNEPRPNA